MVLYSEKYSVIDGYEVCVKITPIASDAPFSDCSPGGAIELSGGTELEFYRVILGNEQLQIESIGEIWSCEIVERSWYVDWAATCCDESYTLIKMLVREACLGKKLGITVEVKTASGDILVNLDGVAVATNYREENFSNGIVAYTCTFHGYDEPIIKR
jgi:hypothetical protein